MKKQAGLLTVSERIRLTKLYREGKAAYGSISNLSKASKLPHDKVEKFLQSKNAYTKYKQYNRKIERLSAKSRFINDIWSMDLAQVDKLSPWNSGTKFLMVVVDIFSRFVRVEPLRNKNAETTKAAFIRMCSRDYTANGKGGSPSSSLQFPLKLWVDRGKEFMGDFRNFCEDVGIKVYHTFSETKACHAERAIRSLKSLIYRYLEDKATDRYLPKLQQLVNTMNSRINRATGMAPADVTNDHFMKVLYNNLRLRKQKKPKFKVGDKVRLARNNAPFRKGYKPQYTNEIFIIKKIATRKPIYTYMIEDQTGEPVYGKFYEAELSKHII